MAGHNVAGKRPLLSFEGWYEGHGLLPNLAIKLSVPLLQNDQEPAGLPPSPLPSEQFQLWPSVQVPSGTSPTNLSNCSLPI